MYGISNDIILSGWITLQLFQTWLAGKISNKWILEWET